MFDLGTYMTEAIGRLVKGIVKMSAFCPEEFAFVTKFARATKKAARIRKQSAEKGENIPPFLIASITSSCNLHCVGCYARRLETCSDGMPSRQLTAAEWGKLFSEAEELGISFILLAGGEPFVRRDVLEEAAKHKNILFPVFTNGTLLTDSYFDLLAENRNLVPILSIEGGEEGTDTRRGAGIHKLLLGGMERLKARKIAFGASVTVTKENADEVTGDAFLQDLREKGCKAVIFVEFVPVDERTAYLAFGEEERARFTERLYAARQRFHDLLMIAFPGDEKGTDGCIAAGRGFFHINSHGGAEPCPFSPFSDTNVRDHSLKEALHSPLFSALREGNLLIEDHKGGCVLFERRAEVKRLIGEEKKSEL